MEYTLNTLFFEVTHRCNAFCKHCGSRCNSKAEKELEAYKFNEVLDSVSKNFGTETIMLNITGGEPLIRKDLFGITGYADKLGFKWGLVTNGTLITDEIIEKMKETHMSTITISLDGMKETHENFRKMPGSFDKIISAIEKLKKANFIEHIQITFIATKENISELENVYSLAASLGVDSIRVSPIDPIGRAEDNLHLCLSVKEYKYLINFVKKHNSYPLPVVWSCSHYLGNTESKLDDTSRKFSCMTGIHVASVLSNGDIFGCPNIPRRKQLIMGNVLKDDFCTIWKNSFELYRNPLRTVASKCKKCEYLDYCKGDSFHTFDFDKNEPKFCYKDIFKPKGNLKKEMVYYSRIINDLACKYGEMDAKIIQPSSPKAKKTVIFTPDAKEELYSIFHFGKRHPLNLYEQQSALIGNVFDDIFLVKYVIPSILYNRSSNMAYIDNETIDNIIEEVNIINENIEKADDIYKDSYGDVRFLGFAHSHPDTTEFRFSINDTKNHGEFIKKYENFLSILLNPQKEKIVCFSGENVSQSKLVLLSK